MAKQWQRNVALQDLTPHVLTSRLASLVLCPQNPEPWFLGPGTESCLSPDLGCSVDLQDLIPHPKKQPVPVSTAR